MNDELNLDDLLASILDPDAPLPTGPAAPQPAPVKPEEPLSSEAAIEEQAEIEANLDSPDDGQQQLTTVSDLLTDDHDVEEVKPFADSVKENDAYALPPVGLPKFTDEEIAKTLDIRNFAVLVTLTATRWQGKVKDKKASRDAASAAGADEDVFETRKKLLADEKLTKIHKLLDQARAKHYEMTVPWTTTGVNDGGRRAGARLLPNTSFFDYCSELGTLKNEVKEAVDELIPAYPQLVEQAKKKLGRSFDIRDYPSAEELRRRFGVSFDFQPIPEGKDFQGLPQQQCQALADKLAEKTQTMVENAMQDLWGRVHKHVGRMVERLSDPEKMFHASLVENVRGVAQQLKHLNVTGNTDLERLRQYIQSNLCQHEPEDLRKNLALRELVAKEAANVITMMNEIAAKGGK